MAICTITQIDNLAGGNMEMLFTDRTAYEAWLTEWIPQIEADFLEIRNKPFDTDDAGATVYPANAAGVALRMLYHRLNTDARSGIKSERMDVLSESVSYDTEGLINGYPRSIAGQIKKFLGVK